MEGFINGLVYKFSNGSGRAGHGFDIRPRCFGVRSHLQRGKRRQFRPGRIRDGPGLCSRVADEFPKFFFSVDLPGDRHLHGHLRHRLPADRLLPPASPQLPAGRHQHHRRGNFSEERGAAHLRCRAVVDAAADLPGGAEPHGSVRGSPAHRHHPVHLGPSRLPILLLRKDQAGEDDAGDGSGQTDGADAGHPGGNHDRHHVCLQFDSRGGYGDSGRADLFRDEGDGRDAGAQGVLLNHCGGIREHSRRHRGGAFPGSGRGIRVLLCVQRLSRRLRLHHSDPGSSSASAGVLRREDRREGLGRVR